MPIEIHMPAVSPSMTEGSLARWLKKEGDTLKAGDLLAEIETDKAIVELVAENDGTLARIVVPDASNNVQVGALIALLLAPGEDAANLTQPSSAAPNFETAATSPATPAATAATASPAATLPSAPATHAGRILTSPLARRLAAERGVDLAGLRGSGPNGRIVRLDVEAAAVATSASSTAPVAVAAANPSASSSISTAAYVEIPNNNMRRMIAKRLSDAKQSIPHYYLTIDCAIDALQKLRQEIKDCPDGAKLSVNDFVIKAAALALAKLPGVNASWTETAIRRYSTVDVSVAVATPTGLITPIVRNAERKGLAQISAEIKDLGLRARSGKLAAEDYQGGGFTISILGMYGIREFAAIINPPQSAILAVGVAEQRAVVKDGVLAIATMMTCTLSADHRVVDGALGAEYLAAFKKLIEHPLTLLL